MDENPYKPLDVAPPRRACRSWFADLSRGQWALFFVGLTLFVWGVIPMAGALVVANRAIDDGPNPGDDELMQQWDWWAFSPKFAGLTLCGIGIVAAALKWKNRGWRFAATAFIALTVFFAYDAHERRKLIPPADLTLATFFDWQAVTRRAAVKELGGTEHMIPLGPLGRRLASGPPAFVFDKSGKLVDWSTDSGDDAEFEKRWQPYGPGTAFDRKAAAVWMAKATSGD
jgi:hypothetical protein